MKRTGKEEPKGRPTGFTSLRRCVCASEYQDARYGPGVRVHNAGRSCWRCTVCAAEARRAV